MEDFKEGKIDLLFVYNMLLTGFDAQRLKKLYIARLVKDHNLLQTLTRVNRPYKNFRYGYVVDFADIRKEFDETNKAYFEELQAELGDEMQNYSNLFKSKEEIEEEIQGHQGKTLPLRSEKCGNLLTADQPDRRPQNRAGDQESVGECAKYLQPDPLVRSF